MWPGYRALGTHADDAVTRAGDTIGGDRIAGVEKEGHGVRIGACAVLLAVVVLTLVGCRATLAVDVQVDADGAGTLGMTVGVDGDLARHLEEAGAAPIEDLAAVGGQTDGTTWSVVEEPAADGGREVVLTGQFRDAEEFDQLAGELTDALDAPEATLLSDLELELTDDTVAVSGTASASPSEAVTELGLQPDQAVALIADAGAFTYELDVGLPGEILRANGEVDPEAQRVAWEVPPGETVAFSAVSERPRPLVWVILGGFAVVGAVTVVALGRLLVRRRGA